jgi:hypothetical protein
MTASAAPTIQYIPAERPATAPAGPPLSALCAAARALIDPIHKGDQRYAPETENAVADLAQLVDRIDSTFVVGRLAEYKVAEAMEAANRIRSLAAAQRGHAADDVRNAKAALAALGIVPPVTDLADGLLDRECRDVVRAMTAPKRAELLEEMRDGRHVRVMLASARHPMPTEFDIEAAKLFGKFSEPAKRTNLVAMVSVYESKKAAAQALLDAADATKAAIARFVELEAARDAETEADGVARFASMVTHPDPSPRAPAVAAPTQWPRATVQIQGSAITFVG